MSNVLWQEPGGNLIFLADDERDELIEQRDKLLKWMRRIESEPINAEYFAREAIDEIEDARRGVQR